MITVEDIRGLLSLAILNNKAGFIAAMRANGYAVPAGISDDALNDLAWDVLATKGADGAAAILNRVRPNKAVMADDIKQGLTAKFGPAGADQRGFGDWFNNTVNFFGDLLGGHSTGTGPSNVTQSTSALSPAIMGITALVGLVLGIIFRKSVVVVFLIIVVVLGVVLYGIFAKTTTSTTTGGTTQESGGIGNVVLGFITGLFK